MNINRHLILFITLLGLTACSTVQPPPIQHDVSAAAVQVQQQRLQQLTHWQLRGQMALFDLVQAERHGMHIEWYATPTHLNMRFYHPLRGTLARLEQTPEGANLIAEDGNEYQAQTMDDLLWEYFRLALPITQINAIISGREQPGMFNKSYQLQTFNDQQLALLAAFTMPATGQLWQGQLSQYKLVQDVFLPHQIELSSSSWRLKLQVSKWQF